MISKYYTEDVTLLVQSSSTGGYWSTGETYTTGVAIKAAVNQLSASELFRYGTIGYDARYKMFCEPTTEVYAGRRIIWRTDTYEIIEEPKNTLQKDHHFRTLLKKVV